MRFLPGFLVLTLAALTPGWSQEEKAATALIRGDYQEAESLARPRASTDPEAARVVLEAMLAQGRYKEAARFAQQVVVRFPTSAPAQVACYKALLPIGEGPLAFQALMNAARTQPDGFNPPAETPASAAARAFALQKLGADPRLVLDRILQPATTIENPSREPFLVLGEIAIEKRDFLLASETFRRGLEHFPDDPDLLAGLASSFQGSMEFHRTIERALKGNSRHVPALQAKAAAVIDAGKFAEARQTLDAALDIDPANPRTWAFRSLLESLEEKPAEAEAARAQALDLWPTNPEIDLVIGAGLGRNYRFEEAIVALRRAHAMDPTHGPVQFELGSSLLRFGAEEEGWTFIEQVQARDPYHVAAFNLVTLKDVVDRMQNLDGKGVRVRMDRREAAIYGARVLALCEEARRTLAKKYGIQLPFRVLVDMLPTQQDFAIRTFALPVGEGFLAVCFGPLITTASPNGRLGRANWEGVLWHEMAHTITLTATRHRIPRWLSEGISVHEENAAGRGWGMAMNSSRRRAILENGASSIAELQALFEADMDRAYFESSLMVDFLVQRVGMDGIRRILDELADAKGIQAALESVAGPLDEMEAAFVAHAKAQAEAYGPRMDWRPLSDPEYAAFRAAPDAFVTREPRRFFAVMARANDLADEQKWPKVKALIEPLIALEPANRESDNPYLLLARAHRELGDSAAEKEALEKLLALDAGSFPAARRLLEIASDGASPHAAADAARAVLAIHPAQPDALLALARSQAAGGRVPDAGATLEGLLALDPPESAGIRMEYARLLASHGDPRARRQVLLVLEQNPRFEAALNLLQEINRGTRR